MRFLFLLLIPSLCLAEGPVFKHKEPVIQREFENSYQDLRFLRGKTPTAVSKTLAEIRAYTPASVGEIYYCSNCATDAICVSTGTVVGSFSRVSARTTACQ